LRQPLLADSQEKALPERASDHIAIEHEAGSAEHPRFADLSGIAQSPTQFLNNLVFRYRCTR
jgi:hypothetical protein